MAESSELRVDVLNKDGATVLTPAGEVDLARSPSLRTAIRGALNESPKRLVVDLGSVTYMDSSGVATLVEALKLSKGSGASMVLCSMSPQVLSIFEIARLDQVFSITGSVDEAMSV